MRRNLLGLNFYSPVFTSLTELDATLPSRVRFFEERSATDRYLYDLLDETLLPVPSCEKKKLLLFLDLGVFIELAKLFKLSKLASKERVRFEDFCELDPLASSAIVHQRGSIVMCPGS